ncbi:hypothetical protein UFOVP1301_58 [uncultured Caudovirales phage]|uniref:Uncharacterized protein n=1 Tax=uncultured Caudovirales phage TaxID=2100421 RepID=A0A6J5PHL4_9CAUD|nr:hypothetical protein UFOVP663_43 [uncultured Caudovirales phage]CAB4168655.1 hypothetical protein UFOVP894_19 [uncultured Caudovirales phage]CAB4180984.1 hypothetical protein UFOVP1069_9 [uncultured Caudovirales phage]CAB4196138.1 hypothetical protein UFOVP1301_58 [uncultured Caudovirales phage]CAB4210923.1 hypothetical protein UFOVP1415_56 [uncultured Caudovirales phage]
MTRAPTEMELRVAKALYEHEWQSLPNSEPFGDGCKDYWVSEARAAIRAMREPTTEMEARVIAALDKVMRENHGKHMNVWADVMPPILARAAIRAMHTPTTEMLREAGLGATSSTEDIAYMWEAMIDAASPQEE